MCGICGCGSTVTVDGREISHDEAHRLGLAHEHAQDHSHGHGHSHAANGHAHDHGSGDHHHHHHHDHAPGHGHHHDYGAGAAGLSVPGLTQQRLIEVETSLLARNDGLAAGNRRVLSALRAFAVNLVSSPGSGKTTLLCRTISMLEGQPLAVIEGDQQTENDADRIRATGARAVQVNTGKGCHLDAQMVGGAMDALRLEPASLLFIENVGNLVCPAAFDLGEDAKVAILSVTEGEDKSLKYPDMFTAARLAILNKIDLAPHCDADPEVYETNLRRVNPGIDILRLSARTGEGMQAWIDWLRAGLATKA